jgi:hypothetical protein
MEFALRSLAELPLTLMSLSLSFLILFWYAITQTSRAARLLSKLPGPPIFPLIGAAYLAWDHDSEFNLI